jgi:hypothetical protein
VVKVCSPSRSVLRPAIQRSSMRVGARQFTSRVNASTDPDGDTTPAAGLHLDRSRFAPTNVAPKPPQRPQANQAPGRSHEVPLAKKGAGKALRPCAPGSQERTGLGFNCRALLPRSAPKRGDPSSRPAGPPRPGIEGGLFLAFRMPDMVPTRLVFVGRKGEFAAPDSRRTQRARHCHGAGRQVGHGARAKYPQRVA